MAVEGIHRGLQRIGQIEGAELGGAGGGLRQILADVLPQVAVNDRVGLHEVVAHRHTRQLHDAALNRVHQAEIGHDPGEERAFLITGAAQEERRRGEVIDRSHTLRQLAIQGLDAVDPEPRGFLVLDRFLLVVAGQRALGVSANLVPIAMVRFVVEDVDAVVAEQLAARPLQHLSVGFRRFERLGIIPLKEAARYLGKGQRLAMLKGMVVGDHDLRAPDVGQHLRRHDLARLIIVVRLARLEHAESILDRDAGCDD